MNQVYSLPTIRAFYGLLLVLLLVFSLVLLSLLVVLFLTLLQCKKFSDFFDERQYLGKEVARANSIGDS